MARITSARQSPVVTVGAYSSGDVVGGLLTFKSGGATGVVRGVTVIDFAKQSMPYELWLFMESFTPIADNGVWAPTDATLLTIACDPIQIATSFAGLNNGVSGSGGLILPYDSPSGQVFGQLVVRGTPTYAAVDDVTVILRVEAN